MTAPAVDLAQARSFIRALTGLEDVPMTWQTFDDSGARRPQLTSVFSARLEDAARDLRRLNEQGAGIFVCVNETNLLGRKEENVTRVRAHFVDADGPMLRPFALAPSFRVDSSPGREHGYFLADGNATLAGFPKVQAQLATFYGTDPSVKDLPRVMRVPGFYHHKRKPYLVRFILGAGACYSVAELLGAHPIEEKRAEPKREERAKLAPADTRAEKLLRIARDAAAARPWSEGNRHSSAKATAAHARKLGLPDDAVRTVVLEPATAAGLQEAEVDQILGWTLVNVSPDPEEIDPPRTRGALALAPTPATEASTESESQLPEAEEWKPAPKAPKVEEPDAPVITTLSDVQPESVSWLWWHRAALGKITVIDGDPGLGKSMLSLDLAAAVTTGAPLPGGRSFGPCDVVIMTAEDGLADTIRPRLEAAGGDATKVTALIAIRQKGRDRFPSLLRDVAMLESVVIDKAARLVIIDPLMAFLSGSDAHKDQDIRAALAPVAAMAERTGAAVIVIRHLNKAQASQAIYRGGGSIGITGAARAVFLVAKDPQDDTRRIVACVKNNLAPMPASIAYTIEGVKGGSARLRWDPRPIEITADQLLAAGIEQQGDKGRALVKAEEFLTSLLGSGPKKAAEVKDQAEGLDHSWATVRRAKTKLGIRPEKTGENGEWSWRLPEGVQGAQGAQGAQESKRLKVSTLTNQSDQRAEGAHVSRLEHVSTLSTLSKMTADEDEVTGGAGATRKTVAL